MENFCLSVFISPYLANTWCKEQFKTVVKEYHVKKDFLDTSKGRALLTTTLLSLLTPICMFLIGKYNLEGR